MKLIHWIFAFCLFTSSCDLILNLNFGGHLRICQLLMVLVCAAALGYAIQEGRILWPRGGTALALWVLAQMLFVPLSGVMSIGLTFFGLMLFTVAWIFSVVQLYGQSDRIESLIRIYLLSFVLIAAVGLLQFILPLMGLPSFYVGQWFIHGRVARINAFSLEPSYFATYLVMGWIAMVELRLSGARILKGRFWKVATIIVTAALLFSSSKTAWLIMLVELAARIVPTLWAAQQNARQQLRRGQLRLKLPSTRMVIYSAIFLVFVVALVFQVYRLFGSLTVLLGGSGLAGTPAHSWNDRIGTARGTWATFMESPFVGKSLGGVPVAIAAMNGVTIHNMDEARLFWGFPVLLDVLVASGIFGFIPFVIFMYSGTFGALRLAKKYWPQERAKWLKALARAMIFEWLMLLADQNLLRVYLWFHIAIVATVAYHLEFASAPESAPERTRRPFAIIDSPITL